MARKSKHHDWTPNPDCEAAYGRVLDTALICSAVLWGEKLESDRPEDAPPHVLIHAFGFIYFLRRIDPKDLAALSCGPGSFADFAYKPFPPGYWMKKPRPGAAAH
jgi:hypothetical protein